MTTTNHYFQRQPSSFQCDADSLAYIETLYAQYVENPNSVSLSWQQYFSNVSERERQSTKVTSSQFVRVASDQELKQNQILHLEQNFRKYGHFYATLDPLQLSTKPIIPELDLAHYGLNEKDLATIFDTTVASLKKVPLQKIIESLKQLYCQNIAIEYLYIDDQKERQWIQEQYEARFLNNPISSDIQRKIFETLVASEGLERYLGNRYPGVKRFSLEGNDSLIVAMNQLLQKGGELGVKEVVIGMAHRGRLNVLINTLGKNPTELFKEFEGKIEEMADMSGDVKYHQGFSSDIDTANGTIHVSLAFNPSHLEIVSPVVSGSVFARQLRRQDKQGKEVVAILLHGDASFSGQGVVMETLNMSQTKGFSIGGAIHIIVNNQIGFTTNRKEDARSSYYCSDIAKMIQMPVLHVNADDPEVVYKAAEFAMEYRQTFHKDIMIDLVGYRRHGHNEADEPSVTQPLMYQVIKKLPTVLEKYSQHLNNQQVMSSTEISAKQENYRSVLDRGENAICPLAKVRLPFTVDWQPYFEQNWRVPYLNTLSMDELKILAKKRDSVPVGWNIHPRLKKIIEDRNQMTEGILPMDWGYAETLAYASLLVEGYGVRLSGQDCGRGTFFHRHVVYHNQANGERFVSLAHVSDNQAPFNVIDSLLSEEAVLGFEYGIASCDPKLLVIWEAQFGDFANGAQVIVDQFMSSAERKWGRLSGLTLLLPHGYEGQGPEHSSARLERYLQLCAEQNMQVCIPSTPSQIFHVLRRQVLRPIRKPLIVISPKSLLRHKEAVSSWDDIISGQFCPLLTEKEIKGQEGLQRVVLCSGKVYYDLLEARKSQQKNHVAIIRIEQLYPFPDQELQSLLSQYAAIKDIVWCQEEPQNQGAWNFIQERIRACLARDQALRYVGRFAHAAPATGYTALHRLEQNQLIQDALA